MSDLVMIPISLDFLITGSPLMLYFIIDVIAFFISESCSTVIRFSDMMSDA